MGLSAGSEGAKVSVGIGYAIGKAPRARSKKRSSNLSSIAQQSRSIRRGRNCIVGRNNLVAYSGDLPSPLEVADTRGLIDLAKRYGYGDWSDDEDSSMHKNDDDDDVFWMIDKQRKRPSRKKQSESSFGGKKKRKETRRTTSSEVELGIEFGVGVVDSSIPLSQVERFQILSSTSESSCTRPPPRPMELLGNKASTDRGKSQPLTCPNSASPSKGVSPAMGLLEEVKSKKHNDTK